MLRNRYAKRIAEAIFALALAALVLFSASALAKKVSLLEFSRHSRALALLARRERAAELFDKHSLHMVSGFAEALVEASVGLEQIPTDELATFFAIFDSLPKEVRAEHFEYSGETLIIKGAAENYGGYKEFIENLNAHRRFSTVSGEIVENESGVAFTVVCELRS